MPKPEWLASEWYSITAKWRLAGAALDEAFDDATRLALADQDHAGIDIVCDGEQPFTMQPNEFDAFLAADTRVTGRVVKAANIKPN
jgi:methionine synthase II (cobalamin-independent)